MIKMKNILVGVDLAAGDRLVSNELAPSTVEAIERALWIAKLNSARLQLFFSLDIGARAQQSIQADANASSTVLGEAERVLGGLVDRVKEQGIEASYRVTFGKSWIEIIRQVLREDSDLVIVGGNQRSVLERLFIGSTGMNLLRSCPCPVWVTHPPRANSHEAILVGHDLTEVGDLALELGAKIAELHQAPLHVVHVVEAVQVNAAKPLDALAAAGEETRQAARAHIASQLEQFKLAKPAEVQVVEGSPDEVLRDQIEQHDIALLVMGTLARGGIEGLLIGNTAERLLPKISCSVLAVKPANFQTPITLD